MTLSRKTRRVAGAILTSALALGLALGGPGAGPASARLEEAPIEPEVRNGWSTSIEYDGMLVNEPASVDHEPETCETVPWCTLILVQPKYPENFDPGTEWIIDTVITWDAKPVVDGTAQGNDLDIYVYTYEDTLQDDGTYEKEYREVNRSASARMPETMKLFGPPRDNPTLYMVVYNFLGQNLGFRVDMTAKVFSYDDPDSYLQPAGTPGRPGSGEAGAGGSEDPGFRDEPMPNEPFVPSGAFNPTSPSDLAPTAPGLTPPGMAGALAPSAGFAEGLGDFRDLAEDLSDGSGSAAGILDRIRNRTVGPPQKVPAPVLFFWLVIAPIVVGGAALVWFLRRRPAALTLAVR